MGSQSDDDGDSQLMAVAESAEDSGGEGRYGNRCGRLQRQRQGNGTSWEVGGIAHVGCSRGAGIMGLR